MTDTRPTQRNIAANAPAARPPVPRAESRPPASSRPPRRPPPRARSSVIYSFLLWTTVTIAALAVAAGTFLFIAAPTDLVRDQLIQQVRERTGREMHVAGRTSFRIFPHVGVRLERASLSSPHSMGSDPMLRIAEVEANVEIWPLLRGEVRVGRLVLRRPELNLRVDTAGRRTWDFAQPVETEPLPRVIYAQMPSVGGGGKRENALRSFALHDVRIDDGTIRYSDDRKNTQEEISDLNLRFALPSLSTPLKAKGNLNWRRERMTINIMLDSPAALVAGASSPLTIAIAGRPVEMSYSGSISAGQRGVDGEVTLKTESLRTLASWLGRPLPKGEGPAPLSLKGNIQVDAATTKITNADILLDDTHIRGTISHEGWNGPRPLVNADLHLSALDINQLLPLGDPGVRERERHRGNSGEKRQRHRQTEPAQSIEDLIQRESASPGSNGQAEPQVRGFVARHGWSEVPFNFASLGLFDGTIRLATDRVLYRDVKTGTARIEATIDNRVLTARLEDMQIYGGKGEGLMRLDASNAEPTLQTKLQFSDVSAFEFLKDSSEFDWISGKGRVFVAVAGRGKTERQMVETLAGEAEFAFRDGALVGYNIPQMIGGLQKGKLPDLDRNLKQKTEFSELAATFKITNGIAENRDLRLTSPVLRVTGAGTADLPRRTLNYLMRPKLVASLGQTGTPSQQGFELPVKITGSWDRPNVQPDFDSVLKDPDKVIEAAKEVGRQLKGKDVNEVVRGLLGNEGDADDNKTKKKARELLNQFLKN